MISARPAAGGTGASGSAPARARVAPPPVFRPEVNQRVVLRVGPTAELTSRVEDHRGADEVLVAHPFDGTALRRLAPGQVLTIEWSTARGLARAAGLVVEEGALAIPAHGIRIAAVEVVQRRSHVRARMVIPIEGLRESGERARGCTLDVSGAGICFRVESRLRTGEPLVVALRVPGAPDLEVRGRVVRRHDENTYALRFEDISAADRERIIRLVFASHRHDLAVLPRSA